MRRAHEAGSVLVEALVALAIVAVTLTVACQAVGQGARRTAAVETSRLAMLEARSRLEEVGADIPLAPGESSGQDVGLLWRVVVTPAQGSGAANGRLMDVVVTAERDGREAARLHSLRWATTPAASLGSP